MALRVDDVVLRSSLDLESLARDLLDVQAKYPVASHYFVASIVKSVTVLNEEDARDRCVLEDLIAEIQRAEIFYTETARPWDRNDTSYENGVVIWPDNYRLDLTKHPEEPLLQIFSKDVLEAVRVSVRTQQKLDERTRDRLLEQAIQWDDPSRDSETDRRALRTRLTSARRQLEQTASNLDQEVALTAVITNKSRRPNTIAQGLLIIQDSESGELVMRLRQDDARISSYDSRVLEYYRAIASLDEDAREKVRGAFEHGGGMVFRAIDINSKEWDAYPRFVGKFRASKNPDCARRL